MTFTKEKGVGALTYPGLSHCQTEAHLFSIAA